MVTHGARRKFSQQLTLRLDETSATLTQLASDADGNARRTLSADILDFRILDRVQTSVYANVLQYLADERLRPRPTLLPMLRFSVEEISQSGEAGPRELSVDIKFLPLHITLDQDTLHFVEDALREVHGTAFDLSESEDEGADEAPDEETVEMEELRKESPQSPGAFFRCVK